MLREVDFCQLDVCPVGESSLDVDSGESSFALSHGFSPGALGLEGIGGRVLPGVLMCGCCFVILRALVLLAKV